MSICCTCAKPGAATYKRRRPAESADHAGLAGARARLQQWNISEAQIDAVEKAGKADQYLPLNSPFAGVVEEIAVHQGRHVAVGDHLMDIVDLSSVWVWAEFYENELPLLKPGLGGRHHQKTGPILEPVDSGPDVNAAIHFSTMSMTGLACASTWITPISSCGRMPMST